MKGSAEHKNGRNKINIDKIDLNKEKEKTTENPGLIPFAHNIGSVVIKAEDQGKLKGRAMAAMKEQTEKQMNQLYRQMQILAEQANEIKIRIDVSLRIYNAQMNFEPLIGHTYYLYEKNSGEDVLSMIGPGEWGKKYPYKNFLAEVKLMSDHTWEVKYQ
jgi:chaperonin cofactor prefoldin